ncbi:uncharacterized protein EDB91DRAFT_1253008 [Suillus paluster]|uniref:uncharacterized protein n=1 Tax=Suillus paluster TaxID=48578 RepID=UPI001B86E0B4|nr:uncharacterized protein EDB91DRAFT_1253008 [Suillus paluster]KAG1729495.1 hypothetical protein EDB91DRAFT_1253008 [Suillus paluster]
MQHLVTHPLDTHIIFYEGKKSATSSNKERPSRKDKGEIYQVLAKLIFTNDSEYSGVYAEDSKKFNIVKSFKEQLDKFNKTGAGVTPLNENTAVNLHKQVLLEFPWYDQLHPFLFSNPTCGVKIFTSQLGVDYAGDFYMLIHPRGGPGPSTDQNTPDTWLTPPDARLAPPDSQLTTPDPQLATPDPRLAPLDPQLAPPLPQLAPPLPQLAPPLPQLPPPLPQLPPPLPQLPPPLPQLPLQSPHAASAQPNPAITLYPPPPHYTGAGGSPITDLDGDLSADPHATANDDDRPFFAPLGNALLTLDRDFNMYNNNGLEFNSSWHRVVNLNSPPKVVGHKQQYAASPSPPPIDTNTFVMPQKPQTPTYHSHTAFGSALPAAPLPHPVSSLPYMSSDYRILPMESQTLLSVKPQSSTRSKKKRTSVADVEDHLSMINGEIQSMHSNMSKRRESKNEHYAIKMNYQSQKKEYQWRHESCLHEVLLSAANHQCEQEAKDKEILRLQAATALQEKEAEIWHLKIQY